MCTYSIGFEADVEMTGDDPHPPVLTALVRPNLVVGSDYCLCYFTETSPAEGVARHGRGSFKATAVCSGETADRFTAGAEFELRAGLRVFRNILSRTIENEPAKP